MKGEGECKRPFFSPGMGKTGGRDNGDSRLKIRQKRESLLENILWKTRWENPAPISFLRNQKSPVFTEQSLGI